MVAARFSAILLIALATSLSAQTAPTNQLALIVTDPAGAVIPGARISIMRLPDDMPGSDSRGDVLCEHPEAVTNSATQATFNLTTGNYTIVAVTNPAGRATLMLNTGTYAVSITIPGFERDIEKIDVRGNSDQPSTRTFALHMDRFRGGYPGPGGFDLGPLKPEIPPEHEVLDISIPLQPLQTLRPASTRVRKHRS